MPMELAVDLATLALYDIIIYAGWHWAFSQNSHRLACGCFCVDTVDTLLANRSRILQ